jgi:threonine synthase
MQNFVTHLESTHDGTRLPKNTVQTIHGEQPVVVSYDLGAVGRAVTRTQMAARPASLWKWRELLPYQDERNVVSLGENQTPLLDCPRLAARIGIRKLWIKDESMLPTGSFKARGMAMAVTMAKELGITHVAAPTAGNAGGALAAYAARAGIHCTILMPEDTPIVNQLEAAAYGARAFLVDGLIHQCGAIVKEGAARGLWFDMSTMKEPYRLEGKKTMGLELAEQLGWRLPDAIFYPTGGGTGLIGMHKAFAELSALGWTAPGTTLPRMFVCQAEGCAPMVTAWQQKADRAQLVADAWTKASGLRVPKPFADKLILQCLRETGGAALAAREDDLMRWFRDAMALEGIAICPETGACLATLHESVHNGRVHRDCEVVVFNTGAAQKYVEALQTSLPRLRRDAIDWHALGG